jgi:hypothetical protein
MLDLFHDSKKKKETNKQTKKKRKQKEKKVGFYQTVFTVDGHLGNRHHSLSPNIN